jgi:hypothetical protein
MRQIRVGDDRWAPTLPKAKYIFHKNEYAAWEADGEVEEFKAANAKLSAPLNKLDGR